MSCGEQDAQVGIHQSIGPKSDGDTSLHERSKRLRLLHRLSVEELRRQHPGIQMGWILHNHNSKFLYPWHQVSEKAVAVFKPHTLPCPDFLTPGGLHRVEHGRGRQISTNM